MLLALIAPSLGENRASLWATGGTIRPRRSLGGRTLLRGGSWQARRAGSRARSGSAAGWKTAGCRSVRIERIDPRPHDRSVFDCGDPAVDGWLRLDAVEAVGQVGVLVHVATEGGRVVCCYRLGSFQVQAPRPVISLRSCSLKRMPVNAVVGSRLGVDRRWERRGLGTWLMWHALKLAAAAHLESPARRCAQGARTCARVVPDLGSGPSTATRDGATCRCETFGPTSRLQLAHRAPPSWLDQDQIVEPTHRPGDGGVGRGPQAQRSWIASRHYPGCRNVDIGENAAAAGHVQGADTPALRWARFWVPSCHARGDSPIRLGPPGMVAKATAPLGQPAGSRTRQGWFLATATRMDPGVRTKCGLKEDSKPMDATAAAHFRRSSVVGQVGA